MEMMKLNNQIQDQKMKDMLDEREKKFSQMLNESRRWF
jgi:mannitol/fructose-specific phosphotransferase system IIA component (Ntr-type)